MKSVTIYPLIVKIPEGDGTVFPSGSHEAFTTPSVYFTSRIRDFVNRAFVLIQYG